MNGKEEQPETITLRPFELSDVDDFMVWASDDRVSCFCSWESYTDKADLLNYMMKTVLPHPWFKAICIAGRPVGAISVTPGAGNYRCRGEMGYVLGWRHWGKGIMTAAARMALERVFREVEGLQRVEALVQVGNLASQRVLEKAGFQKEGVLRKFYLKRGEAIDLVMYSFLSTDQIVD